MSVSILSSLVHVTGSQAIYQPNFLGLGGTLVIQSGNNILISGAGQGSVTSGTVTQGQLDAVSGFATGISGYLQNQIALSSAGVITLNGASGNLTIAGTGSVSVARIGQTIYISGQNWTTSGDLNLLSGWINATFATITNLCQTGATLYGILTGESGALINQIVATGQQTWNTANNNGINLSGQLNSLSGYAEGIYVHRTGDELIAGLKAFQQIAYQSGWPISLGISNQFPTTGLDGVPIIIGAFNTGGLSGYNTIIGIANTFNNSGVLASNHDNTGNMIIGNKNIFDSRGGGGVYENIILGHENTFNAIGDIRFGNSNHIYGDNNLIDISSGRNSNDNCIIGRDTTFLARSGDSVADTYIIGGNNIMSADNSISCYQNRIIGDINQLLFQSGKTNISNYIYGAVNTIEARSGVSSNGNHLFGVDNHLRTDYCNDVESQYIVGETNNIRASLAFHIRRNFIFGYHNELIQIGQDSQNDNVILGNNNRQRTGSYNLLIGHGLDQAQTTGYATFGLGTSYLQINSGISGAIFNNLNVGIGVSNPTGALHVNGAVCLSGISTSTTANVGAATLPANPVGFVIINITGSNFKIPYYNI